MQRNFNIKKPALFAGAAALFLASGAFIVGLNKAPDANATTQSDDASADEQYDGPPPAPVKVAEAVRTRLAPLAETPGAVIAMHDSLIAAATAGKVEWVVEVGESIKAGDVIARLEPDDAILLRDEARTDISRLKSRADFQAGLVQRFEDLGEESGETESSLDQMRATRDEARQDLARAEVALRRAETMLDRMTVRAPFAGRVAARSIDIGEFAAIGAPLVRLVDTENVEVTAQAPSSLLTALNPGDHVNITYGGDTRRAEVRAIVPVGDDVTRMLEVRLALSNGANGPEKQDETPAMAGADITRPAPWPIGAPVRVGLPAATPRLTIAAPRDALILRAGRISVYKIDENGAAKRVDIETGAAEGDLIEIIGDVAAGDKLVIRGGERLRDGQRVTVKAEAAASTVS